MKNTLLELVDAITTKSKVVKGQGIMRSMVNALGVFALGTTAAAGVSCVEVQPHATQPVQAVIESMPKENLASKEPQVLYRGGECELNNRAGW